MKPPQNAWPQTENAQRILFFAQVCEEMLRYNSYESFRLQSLDLLSRLSEFSRICQQARLGRTNEKTIVPAAEELKSTLGTDDVAQEILGRHYKSFGDILSDAIKSKSKDFSHYINSTEFVQSILQNDYRSKIEERIISIVTNLGELTKIYHLTKSYLPIIINEGYAQEYIFKEIQDTFFNRNIKRADSRLLTSFFDRFDGQEKEFNVWIPLDKNTARFYSQFGFGGELSPRALDELPATVSLAIRTSGRYSPTDKYIQVSPTALDPFSAMKDADFILRILISTTILDDRGVSSKPKDYAFVSLTGTRTVDRVHRRKSRIQPLSKGISESRTNRILTFAGSVMSHFSERSRARMISTFESVNLARASESPENQLILIWSSLEVLFGNPKAGEARITHYTRSLIACLSLNYLWRYTSAVVNQLVIHHRHLLIDTINCTDLNPDDEMLENFLSVVLNPNYQLALTRLLDGLRGNPAALERVERLRREFSTPSEIKRVTHRHEQRLYWQVHRIYRARNDFIHAGYKPRYIDQLAMNSFEYFKTAVLALLFRSEKHRGREIDFHISAIILSNNARKDQISGFGRIPPDVIGAEIAAFIRRT